MPLTQHTTAYSIQKESALTFSTESIITGRTNTFGIASPKITVSTLTITPRRSMAFFALLALGTSFASYAVILLLAAGCFSLIFLVKSVNSNIQVLLLCLFGMCVGAALVWSVIPRWDKFTAPGVPLDPSLQPRLFAELDEIARQLGEKLPHEVYLISAMNAYVADRGGWMGFQSRRVMALGLPLLSVLTVAEFRAVLAHEFAHYYGGDTRLGPWVFKTRMAMIRAFENVGSLGGLARTQFLQALYMIVVTVIKWNFRLFLLITNFVSRKQEYRADELACLVAGVEPLKRGLEKIHAAGAAWKPYWDNEVFPVVQEGKVPYIAEGYAKFVTFPAISGQIDKILKHRLENEKQSSYDTHPPLRKRLTALNTINPPSQKIDMRMASSLLDHVEETEMAFVRHELQRLPAQDLPHVPWSGIALEVTLPMWKRIVAEHEGLLMGLTVAGLPDAVGNLEKLGNNVGNPKGFLLSQSQRTERAAFLLGAALGLILVESGWELHRAPAELYLMREGHTANPFGIVARLRAGQSAEENWASECGLQEVAGVLLGSAGKSLSSPGAERSQKMLEN